MGTSRGNHAKDLHREKYMDEQFLEVGEQPATVSLVSVTKQNKETYLNLREIDDELGGGWMVTANFHSAPPEWFRTEQEARLVFEHYVNANFGR